MAGDPRHTEGANDDLADQRQALIAAFTRLATERGYAAVQAEEVARTGGLPPDSFAQHFASKEHCAALAYEAFIARLVRQAEEAIEPGLDWPLQVRAAVRSALGFIAEAALPARFFAVEALAFGGPIVFDRYLATLRHLAALLRQGREHSPEPDALPEIAEAVLIGGCATLIAGTLMDEKQDALPKLEVELVTMLLTPYLGRERAEEIAG